MKAEEMEEEIYNTIKWLPKYDLHSNWYKDYINKFFNDYKTLKQ